LHVLQNLLTKKSKLLRACYLANGNLKSNKCTISSNKIKIEMSSWVRIKADTKHYWNNKRVHHHHKKKMNKWMIVQIIGENSCQKMIKTSKRFSLNGLKICMIIICRQILHPDFKNKHFMLEKMILMKELILIFLEIWQNLLLIVM
jgi:hypothetical protein